MNQVGDNDNKNHSNDNECARSNPPIDESENDLCRTIWIATIVQGVIDATGKNCNRLDQAQALNWLEAKAGITSDFADVCGLAGLDFHQTQRRCLDLVKGKGLDFRCMKKPKLENRATENRSRYYRRVERNERIRSGRSDHLSSQRPRQGLTPGAQSAGNDNLNQPNKENIYEQAYRNISGGHR